MTAAQTMAKNGTAESAHAIPASTLRKAPEIDPRHVQCDHAGFVTRNMFVRAPTGMIADDCKERSVFASMQRAGSVAARKHDKIYIVAFDESWAVDAYVGEADRSGITLVAMRVITMSSRTKELPSDEKFRVAWNGVGYVVERKADGHVMTQPVGSEMHAERDMRALWPQTSNRR